MKLPAILHPLRRSKPAGLCAIAAALAITHPAPAEDIIWDFGTAVGSAAPLSQPANLTVSDVIQGNNNGTTTLLSSSSASSGYTGASGNFNAGAAARTGPFDPALSAYFETTLTPAAGYRVTLTGMDFGTRRTGTGPVNYSIHSSADNFTTPVASGVNPPGTSPAPWELRTHSGLSVASTAPLTIRIFGHDGTGSPAAGTANWRIDDLKLSVVVALEGTPAPTISSVAPLSGTAGTPVTITGTNFGAAPAVRFKGTLAPGATVNPAGTSITATVPAGATTGPVTVTAEGGQATSPLPFDVIAQPVLSVSILPDIIPENAPAPGASGTISVVDPPAANVLVTLGNSAPAAASVPASVTILAGSTSASFNVNAIPNPASFSDVPATITATAAGYDQGSATVTIQNTDALPTLVVINKFLNVSTLDDMVELLVIGNGTPGSTVDMRNMLLKDFSASMGSDNGGKFRFNGASLFSAVKAGTLVVLSNNTTSSDTDAADYVLKLGLADTTYFTLEGTSAFDIATTEMVMIKGPGQPAAGVTGSMHALAGGLEGGQFTAALPKKLIATGTSAGGKGVVANNSTSALADFDGTDATGDVSLSASGFGLPNNTANNRYIRALRGVVTVDGSGVASITNGTPASPFAGRNYFPRTTGNLTAAINLISDAGPDALTSVRITVPPEFGPASAGNVTVTGSGAGFPSVTVKGQEVAVTGTNITTANAALISIGDLTAPTPIVITDDGRYAFATATAGPNGTLTNIAAAPVAVVSIPVANLRDVDANGVCPDNGKTVAVDVVCTEENFNTGSTSAFGQEGNFGINIFVPGVEIGLTRGRLYAITGQVTQFNGLTEILPGNADNIIDIGEFTQPAPLTVSVPDLLANAETYEGRVIRVAGLNYVTGTWAAAQTVGVTDGAGNPIDIRIQSGSTATVEPTYPATVTGIFGQFDNSSPFASGYQIMPRDAADLETGGGGGGYDAWAASYGLTGSATDDDDRDGASNLLEYGTGSEPTNGASVPEYLLTPIGPTLTVTWAKGAAASADPALAWTVEASLTMEAGTWSTQGVTNVQNSANSISADYIITPGTPKAYLRLKIVRTP